MPSIEQIIAQIRTAIYGKDVRENIALGIETVHAEAQSSAQGAVPSSRKVNGHPLSSDVTVTKADVGLGNVDNTSDANKPVSTAVQTALNTKVPSDATGMADNAYAFENPGNSTLWARSFGEGFLDTASASSSAYLMTGTTTTGKAWRIRKTPTDGDNYLYTTYTSITEEDETRFLIVTGQSWGAEYPLISFYDSSNNLIAYQEVKGNTSHSNKLIMIPVGARRCIVNGRNVEAYRPKVLKVPASTTYQHIANSLKPYARSINSATLSDHPTYTSLRAWPSNYIYSLDPTIYRSITDLPSEFTTYGTVIKVNGNGTRNSMTGYSAYILVNENKVWFGFDNGGAIKWKDSDETYSRSLIVGKDYVSETSTTIGKAKHKNGTEASNSGYLYKTFAVNGGEELQISGYHFSTGYPLYILYDANDTYIGSAELGDTGFTVHQNYIKLPYETRKIIVNGINSKSGSGNNISPSIQKYNGETYDNHVPTRRYLIIGDSYCQGYDPDGSNAGWGSYLVETLGLSGTEYVEKYYGGSRFSANGANNTFEALLADTLYPYDYFTDVVVCGGYNDHAYDTTHILTGINSFVSLVKSKYPNATVHIGFVAWSKQGTGPDAPQDWETRKSELLNTVLPAYQRCVEHDANYLNNVEYWINDDGISSNDGIHPNETGNRNLARAIANAVLTGSAPLPNTMQSGPSGSYSWNNIVGKPSVFDPKAIKTITRDGFTYNYTCLDGTTGRFAQNVSSQPFVIETSTTMNKAKHTNGSEASQNGFMYRTYAVEGNVSYLVSGYHYSNAYPLYIVYNSSDAVIASAELGNTGGVYYQRALTVPSNGRKVIVNGSAMQAVSALQATTTALDTKNTAGATNTSSKIYLVGATSQDVSPQTYTHDTAYVGTDGCLYSGGTKVLTSETKNTAGATDTSSKIYLIGATSQGANPQTYSHDTAYVGTDGCLYSGGTKVLTSHQSLADLNNHKVYMKIYSVTTAASSGGDPFNCYGAFNIPTADITAYGWAYTVCVTSTGASNPAFGCLNSAGTMVNVYSRTAATMNVRVGFIKSAET